MRRILITAVLYTIVATVIFGLVYPFVVTGIAQVLYKDKAHGQLIQQNGQLVGSRILGQPFTAPEYFHSRPSAAGNGYDAASSSDSNYANRWKCPRCSNYFLRENGSGFALPFRPQCGHCRLNRGDMEF